MTISRQKMSLFESNLTSYNYFKHLNNQSFYLLSLQIQHVGLVMLIFPTKNPPGYTNFKEICACPHFNSRQHENEAETKTGLKHEIFKNRDRFENVTF